LEEWYKEQGQLAEASEEGLGSKGAVVPMMMMMMTMVMLGIDAGKFCLALYLKIYDLF
jgi:hypothetical protein